MQVGETFIKVRPDTAGFGTELQRGVQPQAAAAGGELGGQITRQLATVFAGDAVLNQFRQAIGEASDLNEAVSLTGNNFQEAGDQILAMGETSATSMGLANSEALNFANSIGGLFIGFGESRTAAAAMSEDVLQLAADLASAKNLSGGTAEALEVLRSGLVGEVEPLRRIGVALNAAAVEQRALTDSGKSSAAALTEGEKAAARYALIFESLTAQGVVGDFARTADGAANQQRILNAELTNAKAELGQQLLPAYIALIGVVRDSVPILGAAGENFATAASAAGGLAAVLGPIVRLTSDVNDGLGEMTSGVADLNSTVPGLGQLNEILESARRLWAQGIELGPVTAGEGGTSALDDFRGGVEATEAAMELLNLQFGADGRVSIEEWAVAVGEFAAARGMDFAEVLDYIGVSGAAADEILRRLSQVGTAAGTAMGGLAAASTDAANAASLGGLDDQADALREIADAADEATDTLKALYGIQQSLDEANVNVQASLDALSASLAENGATFDISTEAGRANITTAQEAASAIREQTIAARANGASVEDAAASNRFLTEGLRRQLLTAGLSREETERLIETYGRVPRRVLSTIDADAAPAKAALSDAVEKMVTDWAGRTFTATLGLSTGSAAAALGGFEAQAAGQGYTTESAPATAGQGSGPVVVNVNAGTIVGSPEAFAREIAPAVGRELDRYDRGA